MQEEEVQIGMRVRYPRTGTTGRVVALEKERGELYAELDNTNLFYRVDQLVPARDSGGKAIKSGDDLIEQIKKEREYLTGAGFQEAITHTDQSCEGGG
ncbi:MAG: hypothetical protein A4E38_00281 [Methanoregulaceae archaeon PtaB.Bin108]|jgi:hypothetical protein|nr:MAG: hypothetical protein A4E38_00281 [Methanoregulaceae archaeon PtaB.Bin108]OPY40309.1 MAG: hypothetical protein A4E42_02195 [Methanoregulaceae archaeon PtaU1.Bin222]